MISRIDNSLKEPNSGESDAQTILEVKDVAARLGVAVSTLNGWLKEDEARDPSKRVFAFHRLRGRSRRWSEAGFLKLEMAVHHESENGVLAGGRSRDKGRHDSPPDPDAEAALAAVLGTKHVRTR